MQILRIKIRDRFGLESDVENIIIINEANTEDIGAEMAFEE